MTPSFGDVVPWGRVHYTPFLEKTQALTGDLPEVFCAGEAGGAALSPVTDGRLRPAVVQVVGEVRNARLPIWAVCPEMRETEHRRRSG